MIYRLLPNHSHSESCRLFLFFSHSCTITKKNVATYMWNPRLILDLDLHTKIMLMDTLQKGIRFFSMTKMLFCHKYKNNCSLNAFLWHFYFINFTFQKLCKTRISKKKKHKTQSKRE